MRLAFTLLALAAFGCVPDTSREPVEIAVRGRGVDQTQATVGAYDLTLLDARVAVGPLYFCAAAHASDELCATARLELLEPMIVDLLDAEPSEGGVARGTTGRVSSAQFDLGRSFLHAGAAPTPTTSALGGASAVFTFDVVGPARSFTVELALTLDPARPGSTLVMGARTAVDVTPDTATVTLAYDPWTLLASVDLAQLEALAEDGGVVVPVRGDQAYEAVALRLTDGLSPTFEWSPR